MTLGKSSKIPLLSSRAIGSNDVKDSDTDLESVTSDTLFAGCLTFRQCSEMPANRDIIKETLSPNLSLAGCGTL